CWQRLVWRLVPDSGVPPISEVNVSKILFYISVNYLGCNSISSAGKRINKKKDFSIFITAMIRKRSSLMKEDSHQKPQKGVKSLSANWLPLTNISFVPAGRAPHWPE